MNPHECQWQCTRMSSSQCSANKCIAVLQCTKIHCIALCVVWYFSEGHWIVGLVSSGYKTKLSHCTSMLCSSAMHCNSIRCISSQSFAVVQAILHFWTVFLKCILQLVSYWRRSAVLSAVWFLGPERTLIAFPLCWLLASIFPFPYSLFQFHFSFF